MASVDCHDEETEDESSLSVVGVEERDAMATMSKGLPEEKFMVRARCLRSKKDGLRIVSCWWWNKL